MPCGAYEGARKRNLCGIGLTEGRKGHESGFEWRRLVVLRWLICLKALRSRH